MAKAPKKSAEPAGEGHNSKELTEAEEKALFFYHVRKDLEALAVIKAAQAERKSIRKLIQADGIALAEVDYAEHAMTAEDKGAVTDRHIKQDRILYWLGLTAGHQPDLFIDRAPAIERIEKEGERAGWRAIERTSPYAPGSDETAAWERGYDKAQAEAAKNLESAMTKRNAAKASDEIIHGEGHEDPFGEEDEQREAAE